MIDPTTRSTTTAAAAATGFSRLLLVGNAAVTWALVGLIWTIQVVQYPLFERVGREAFSGYHAGHSTRIAMVVVPLMLAELALAVWWALRCRRTVVWVALGLVVVAWLSTFGLQVPAHGVLGHGFDPATWQTLVVTNWIRTVAWSARGVLLGWLLVREVA